MSTTPSETPTSPRIDAGPRATGEEVRDLGRLRRSSTDRHVAGVAGGLARHLDVDPLVLRVAFVVLVFFGGAGLIAYAACWLLVPREDTGSAVVRLDERSRSVVLIIVGTLALLALLGDAWGGYGFPWPLAVVGVVAAVLLSVGGRDRAPSAPGSAFGPAAAPSSPLAYAAPPAGGAGGVPPPLGGGSTPRAPRRAGDSRRRGPLLFWFTVALVAFSAGLLGMADLAGADVPDSAYAALPLGLIGLMLVIGSFFGRAGGLILAGLAVTVVLVAATISDRWDGDLLREAPTSASAVRDEYRIDAGELVLDLRNVTDLASLDGRAIRVEGGIGSLQVILPSDLDVRVSAAVNGPGDIGVFGEHSDGIDIGLTRSYDGGDDAPAVTVDAELGVGEIEVSHS
jgi:phage shock protein PspC (stress-responsive transcriptional regulator)